jgi:heptaprenylglyceryl phosphate synthase
MNNFKILALEGITGIGKTTQCKLIKDYLEKNYNTNKFHIFTIDPEKTSVCSLNKEIDNYLESESSNIAILDGTIASVVALSDLKNNHYNSSIEKLDSEVKSYLNLLHKYRAINCLLYPDSIDYIQKRTHLNTVYLNTFLKGFDYFEQSQIASNLNYLKIDITENDKIIAVFEKIKKSLNL